MKHVLSSTQFKKPDLEDIFERADYFKNLNRNNRVKQASLHVGRQLCTLFYQPSTRTRFSFESAAAKMGMGVISSENAAEFSSAIKGEKLEDTIKVVNGYADIIVLRHEEPGSAAKAAGVSEIPVINAGDGGNEHPTQAVLDTYTIIEALGRADNLDIAFGGDLLYGRTARSLVDILSRVYKSNRFTFIAPPELQLSPDIEGLLLERGIEFKKTSELEEGLELADVVYWTRLQKENLKDEAKKKAVEEAIDSGKYQLNNAALAMMPPAAVILHPLPRVGEINPEIDTSPQAIYFGQAHNGVPVRQSLIDKILTDAQTA